MWGSRSRYERRSRARARRVQRRLERVQRTRGTRAGRPASLRAQLGPPRPARSRSARAAIFGGSLVLGTLLAPVVTANVVSWWSERPRTLTSIAVQGTQRLTGEDVAWATGLERGSSLDDLSTADLETRVEAHPWIRDARVAVLPTGTLIVDVEERVPEAVLRTGGGDVFVDEDGVAFAAVGPAEARDAAVLPLLVGSADADETSLREGLAISAKLAQLPLPGLDAAGTAHRGLELRLPSETPDPRLGWVLRGARSPEVILGSGDVKALEDRLDRLARLLAADLGEMEETETIDLRFAGQAVLRTTSTSR